MFGRLVVVSLVVLQLSHRVYQSSPVICTRQCQLLKIRKSDQTCLTWNYWCGQAKYLRFWMALEKLIFSTGNYAELMHIQYYEWEGGGNRVQSPTNATTVTHVFQLKLMNSGHTVVGKSKPTKPRTYWQVAWAIQLWTTQKWRQADYARGSSGAAGVQLLLMANLLS